jgi:HPt (histidine-containing phosphotransfer) domain-containing protein
MMGQGPSVDDVLAIARAEFASRLPGKVDELARLHSSRAWKELRVAAHKLRGSAATYGFAALGTLAAEIEEILLASACAPDPPACERIRVTLGGAGLEAGRAAGGAR